MQTPSLEIARKKDRAKIAPDHINRIHAGETGFRPSKPPVYKVD
jgi:hypothetical protein